MFNCETRTNNFETNQMKVATLLRDEPDRYKPLVIPNNVTRPTINVHHKVRKKSCQHSAAFGVKIFIPETTEKHYKNPVLDAGPQGCFQHGNGYYLNAWACILSQKTKQNKTKQKKLRRPFCLCCLDNNFYILRPA